MANGSIHSKASLLFTHNKSSGKTILRERATGGLFHISKPYWDESLLLTQLINPTAGVFSGDKMELNVTLAEGAKVSLVSPSATRFYAMKGEGAVTIQKMNVLENAFLEYRPDYTIPHADSIVEQKTCIHLADSARLFYVERFMPGRIAYGEKFSYKKFTSTTKIYIDKVLCNQERIDLDGYDINGPGWQLDVPNWSQSYVANIWIAGVDSHMVEKLIHSSCPYLFDREEPDWHAGCSAIENTLLVCRVIANSSIRLKQAIIELRNALGAMIPEISQSKRTLILNH